MGAVPSKRVGATFNQLRHVWRSKRPCLIRECPCLIGKCPCLIGAILNQLAKFPSASASSTRFSRHSSGCADCILSIRCLRPSASP